MAEQYRQITIDQYIRNVRNFENVSPFVIKKIEEKREIADRIIDAVAGHFSLNTEVIFGSSKRSDIVQARHIAAYLLYLNTDLSLRAIAVSLGRADHTVTINALGHVERLMKSDPELKNRVEEMNQSFSKSIQ